jgi:F-box protein 21
LIDNLQISDILDSLVIRLRRECPTFDELTTRRKALVVASFVRMHNLVGCEEEGTYRELANNYLGIALQHPDHTSLPLISVAIYVCIAQRLGLDARTCGVPTHVHAVVIGPKTESLDGRPVKNSDDAEEAMFLDPFRSEEEVPVEVLHRFLESWSVAPIDFHKYLGGSHTTGLVLRTSRNILASIQEFRAQDIHMANYTVDQTMPLHSNTNPYAEVENAYYSALWCNFIFGRPEPSSHEHDQRQIVPLILEKYEHLYPMDCHLVEKYICPLFSGLSDAGHLDLQETLRVVRAADSTAKQIRARDNRAYHEGVKYRVGQVFRHRRYAYIAVIAGWDVECSMNPHWMATNGIDNLSRGRHQSFYHAL